MGVPHQLTHSLRDARLPACPPCLPACLPAHGCPPPPLPCSYGESEALLRARAEGMHWLLHLDPDELFYPGGPVLSLPAVLSRQPAHQPSVRFMNFEGQPEAGDLVNRYEQVCARRGKEAGLPGQPPRAGVGGRLV